MMPPMNASTDMVTAGNPRRCPLCRLLRGAIMVGGVLFGLQILLGLTGLPAGLVGWLAGGEEEVPPDVRYVVVLGGAGIPSESGLMRTYSAAAFAAGRTGVTYVVALPCDGDPEAGSVGRMRDELVMRGIPAAAVRMEYKGRDTREEAENVRDMLGHEALTAPLVVVTSPTHVLRAVLCFRKAGFRHATGLPARSADVEADIGAHGLWRYGFWGNLESEVKVLREVIALFQYKVKGWI